MEHRGITYRSADALSEKNTPSFSGRQAAKLNGEAEEPCAILSTAAFDPAQSSDPDDRYPALSEDRFHSNMDYRTHRRDLDTYPSPFR